MGHHGGPHSQRARRPARVTIGLRLACLASALIALTGIARAALAARALGARDIAFTFEAPTDGTGLALGTDLRRQAYLILKESVNNAVKYSGCTEVALALRVAGDYLQIEIRDNGRGFDPAPEAKGTA